MADQAIHIRGQFCVVVVVFLKTVAYFRIVKGRLPSDWSVTDIRIDPAIAVEFGGPNPQADILTVLFGQLSKSLLPVLKGFWRAEQGVAVGSFQQLEATEAEPVKHLNVFGQLLIAAEPDI